MIDFGAQRVTLAGGMTKERRGRPKKDDEGEHVTVRLPRDVFDELQARTEEDPERNRSAIVRKALRAWFAYNPRESGKTVGKVQGNH